MELTITKLDELAQQLTALQASDAIATLDQTDRNTLTHTGEVLHLIVARARKMRAQVLTRQLATQVFVSTIVDVLMEEAAKVKDQQPPAEAAAPAGTMRH